jgi:hypothetical protein
VVEGECVKNRGGGKCVQYFNTKFENLGQDAEKYCYVFMCMIIDKVWIGYRIY